MFARFARFARLAGAAPQSDLTDIQRRAVTPTPSFTEQATQPIAGTLPAIPSDFSDFEGMVAQPSATMAAGDIGRFARAGQPMATGLTEAEAAKLASDEANLRQATRLTGGFAPDEAARFARTAQNLFHKCRMK